MARTAGPPSKFSPVSFGEPRISGHGTGRALAKPDSVWLMQAGTAAAFPALEATIRDAGASAHLLQAPARDAAQEAAFLALFDRTGSYDLVWYLAVALGVFSAAVNLMVREAPISRKMAHA